MFKALIAFHTEIRARIARWFRTREVLTVLRSMHEKELGDVPVSQWVVAKQRQSQDIEAVKRGDFGIIDRRSWQYPYIPEALHRLNQPILKNTPFSLRRFSETPIPRRAINIIKNAVLNLGHHVRAGDDYDPHDPDILKKIKIATDCFDHPNNDDSFRSLLEAILEDFICVGAGTIEPQMTPEYKRPWKMWSVDSTTIRIFANWQESTPELPRYAQLTGLKGERGITTFTSDELMYIKDNNRSSTPFGLGCLEICFNTVAAFLGAQDMSGKAGSDQIHKTWLWWEQPIAPGHVETVRRHIQNEAEGQAKVSTMSGLKKPDVLEIIPVSPEDLLLDWQDFLIRIIANGFNLSAMALGIERDVNRSTSEQLADSDFQNAVVPVARKFEDAFTRFLLHRFMGWKELVFEFLGLDDPDAQTQASILGVLYRLNSVTPDEIREITQIGGPLKGGWGKLTFMQTALLIGQATGKPPTGLNTLGGGGGAGGAGGGMGGGGGMSGAAQPQQPGQPQQQQPGQQRQKPALNTSPFKAQDIANMEPEEIQQHQQMGTLPGNQALMQQMNQEQPGILETIAKELQEYFEQEEKLEEEDEIKPAEVTDEDEDEQFKKFQETLHQILPEEQWARYSERHTFQNVMRDPFGNKPTGRMVRQGNSTRFRGPKSGGSFGRYR